MLAFKNCDFCETPITVGSALCSHCGRAKDCRGMARLSPLDCFGRAAEHRRAGGLEQARHISKSSTYRFRIEVRTHLPYLSVHDPEEIEDRHVNLAAVSFECCFPQRCD